MSNYYKNDDDYKDWEYPDQKDIDDIDHLNVGNPDSKKADRMSLPIKLFGGFMAIAFVGSLLIPLIGSFSGSSGDDSIQSEEEFLESIYSEVIEQKVTDVLRDNPHGDSIGYLNVEFPLFGGILQREVSHVHAVKNVNLEIPEGKTIGIVGESGSGKSTLGKAIINVLKLTAPAFIITVKCFNCKFII